MSNSTPDILLINLPFQLEREFIDYPYHLNYQLLANAAYLREKSHAVAVFDAFAQADSGLYPIRSSVLSPTERAILPRNPSPEPRDPILAWWLGCSIETTLAALSAYTPRAVGVFMHPFLFAPFNRKEFRSFLKEIRTLFPGVPVVLFDAFTGGMHYIEYRAEDWIGPDGVDWVLRYETDETLEKAVSGFGIRDSGFEGTPPTQGTKDQGLRTKDQGLREIFPKRRLDFKDLPLPAYDVINWIAFQQFLGDCFSEGKLHDQFGAVGSIPFKLGRGCPYRCSFCSANPNPDPELKGPSFVDVSTLRKQLIALKETFVERRLYFLDEVANAHPKFGSILEMLNEMGWSYEFPNGMRAERLKERHLDLMRGRIGLLSVSAESGSQRVLDEIVHKGLKVEDIERVVKWCSEKEIPLLVHFMIGFPGETRREINETLRFASHLQDSYGATPSMQYATAFPGTALDSLARNDGAANAAMLQEDRNYYALPAARPHLHPKDVSADELQVFRENFVTRLDAHRPQKVIINLTYRCSNRCRFCATADRVLIDGDFEEQVRILREYRAQGVKLVDFDGGEPTLYNRLFDILALAQDLGYERINLTTNGRKLADPEFARRIVTSGLTDLLISLHGPNQEVHVQNTQQPSSFHETLKGIMNALRLKPPGLVFGVNVTVTTYNYKHLETMAQLLVNIGVPKFNVQILTPFGQVYTDVIIDSKTVAPYLKRLVDRFADKLEIQLINLPFCFLPGYERYAMSDTYKLGRHMHFANSVTGAVNLAEYLGSRRYKTAQCEECPYDSVCGGFYDFSDEQETIVPALVAGIGKGG